MGCRALLQEVFLTQGLNPGLMSPALAGRFFTTSTTWEAHPEPSLIPAQFLSLVLQPPHSFCELPNSFWKPLFGLSSPACVRMSVTQPNSWRCHGLSPTRLPCPWNPSGQNTGVGCHFHLQGVFLTQGLNPGLLHCRRMLYHLSYEGSPKFTRAGFYFQQLRRLAGIEIGSRNGYQVVDLQGTRG